MQQTLKRRFSRAILVLLVASLALTFPGFLRPQSETQARPQFPAEWSAAAKTLAEKIASFVGPAKAISLEMSNISSLSASDAADIRRSIEAELTKRELIVAGESSAEAHVTVTLSEGVDGYVWVAQPRGESAERTVMVSVPKIGKAAKSGTKGELSLEKKFVWQQQGKFVDFFDGIQPVGLGSTLVLLEPSQIEYYQSVDAVNWEFRRSVRFTHPRAARAVEGFINVGKAEASFPDLLCTAVFDPDKAQCTDKRVGPGPRLNPKVPGHEESESTLLLDRCGEESIVLSSGNGDWTETDSIQGYLLASLEEKPRLSGSPIETEGPVISLLPDSRDSARFIVHNLKTGEYEAYVVTANCRL